jgi:TonB family protein
MSKTRWIGTLALALAAVLPARAGSPEFEAALPKARVDEGEPAHQAWIQSSLVPALIAALRETPPACGPASPRDRQAFGFVVVLAADGSVKALHWREESDWTRCMQAQWIARRFPAPPKDDFHMAVVPKAEAMPTPPGSAAQVAARLGAPEVPADFDCRADLQKGGAVRVDGYPDGGKVGSGWTVVAFELDGDGRPKGIRVDQSTGQANLDRFALDTVASQTYRPGVVRSCRLRWMVEQR